MRHLTIIRYIFLVNASLVLAGCSNSNEHKQPQVSNLAGAERKARISYDWKDEKTLRVRGSSAFPDYAMIQEALISDVGQKVGSRQIEIVILEKDRIVIDTRDTTVPAGGLIGGLISIGVSELHKEIADPQPGDQYWIYYVDAEVRLRDGETFDRYEFDSAAISKKSKPRGH